MNAHVWVTGAPGMLGCVLVPYLSGLGWKVTSLSRTGRGGTLALDLADASAVANLFEKKPPDLVIHSAAYSNVDGCERDPEFARAANALSTKNLAECCGRIGSPLVYVSTDYVFPGIQKTPYQEIDPTFPVNIYGLTKLEGEYHAAACLAGGAIVRTSWLFGGPNPANFVNTILERFKKEPEVAVLDDQTDSPTSVQDLSVALEKISARLLTSEKKAQVPVYHICNAGATTRLEMTRCFQQWLQLPVVVRAGDRAAIKNRIAVRPEHCVMSCARYEKDFGVKMRPWQEAAREFVLGSSACASS